MNIRFYEFTMFLSLAHGLRTPGQEITFTGRPKIHSHSQMFRYGRSIFCLPHGPKFSDFFGLYLHWVSVVRGTEHRTWEENHDFPSSDLLLSIRFSIGSLRFGILWVNKKMGSVFSVKGLLGVLQLYLRHNLHPYHSYSAFRLRRLNRGTASATRFYDALTKNYNVGSISPTYYAEVLSKLYQII